MEEPGTEQLLESWARLVLMSAMPGKGIRIVGATGSWKSAVLNTVIDRLEHTGHSLFVIRALRTHRNIPFTAISRLDLRARHGHPVVGLADNLAAQFASHHRPVMVIDDFHHVDAYSLAVLEDALRRSDCPLITAVPGAVFLSPDQLAVTSSRVESIIHIDIATAPPKPAPEETAPSGVPLTPRETEVGILTGHLSNWDIAERLKISVRTVENHVSNAIRKTGLPRAELAQHAMKSMISQEPTGLHQ
ncbi:hypothetical protein ANMWB30_24830 [Arthrobacter sp. MWB30]|nr:hypothetical protein ANMWB30_24830 [Arthrobacter sp. MWB30]